MLARAALVSSILVLLVASASEARADCFDAAAQYQSVNPWILRAIAWNESHNQPLALHRNDNGTIDFGLMQINSAHLAELRAFGVTTRELMQGCPNVYVAAWHLRHQVSKYGNTWLAVGAYHSETPALRDHYANQIIAILRAWNVVH
jgi:soluble lytic murein transglycosylase-like protein